MRKEVEEDDRIGLNPTISMNLVYIFLKTIYYFEYSLTYHPLAITIW